jgi:hypothetical protein
MSNRDFDDDFNFDDDFDTGSSDDLGDDLSPDFGDEGDSGDLPDMGDEGDDRGGDGGGGPSRTFIMIAGIMIALFAIGLIALVIIVISNQGPTELEIQATTIVAQNMTTEAQLTETNRAIIAFNETQTAIALLPTDTPPRPTITPTFTPTEAPTLDATQSAGTAFAQTADAAAFQTQTAIAELSLVPPTQEGVPIEAVQQTATALALTFAPQTAVVPDDGGVSGGGDVPTREGTTGGTGQLPDSGFFDDIGGGRDGVGVVVLMGFGLVGVIFISRRLRAVNNK